MDPDANLTRQREILRELDDVLERDDPLAPERVGAVSASRLVAEYVELATGLDDWLSKGGFLPKAWQR